MYHCCFCDGYLSDIRFSQFYFVIWRIVDNGIELLVLDIVVRACLT